MMTVQSKRMYRVANKGEWGFSLPLAMSLVCSYNVIGHLDNLDLHIIYYLYQTEAAVSFLITNCTLFLIMTSCGHKLYVFENSYQLVCVGVMSDDPYPYPWMWSIRCPYSLTLSFLPVQQWVHVLKNLDLRQPTRNSTLPLTGHINQKHNSHNW